MLQAYLARPWPSSVASKGITELACFLCVWCPMLIHKKCPGRHALVRIEGQITKETAIYHPRVAAAFARVIALSITTRPTAEAPPNAGLESVLCNDSCCPRDGRSRLSSAHKCPANQGCPGVEVIKNAVRAGARSLEGALGTSRLLRPVLCQAAAYLTAGGVYLRMQHAPARLNVSDDPTRDVPLRLGLAHSLMECISLSDFRALLLFRRGLSSSASGWTRLSTLLVYGSPGFPLA